MANKSICAVVSLAFLWLASLSTGAARIKEAKEAIATYPFSDPDPVPILARSGSWERNARLYPYHSFDGFSETAVQQDWTVVRMENPYIKLAVLPEVGGKIWGASEKSSGKEFIYTNHVLKFRQIALRGPWTSGGVEFNFGIVGHAPSCATPVDYLVRRNADGSVSCIVGAMDLPSRTRWAVTITLPKDKAFVETRAFCYNPTPLNQSYYVSVGLTDDAVRVLEYARDHPTACYWLGYLLFDKTSTLPFEGAREVHGLFVKCQVQLGLQKMMAAEYASAVEYLQGSKQYPERLGTGRPYDPDLRMQDYLQALCYDKLNRADKAQAARKAVYDYTIEHLENQSRNHYFGALVLKRFGEHEKAENLKARGKPSQEILDVIQAMEDSEDKVS